MSALDHALLARAVAHLRAGELVAMPTETVYGLGADASQPEAVAKIFAAKGRPADHPLIVHLPGTAHLEHWARDIPDLAWELAEDFWPGPLTLILKRAPGVLDAVTGGQDSVGLRVPGHPLALDLLRAFADAYPGPRCGIAAPSANRFGRISPTTAAHVREELGDPDHPGQGAAASLLAMILDGGPCMVGIESTIIDLTSASPRLLRPGAITPERIAACVGVWPQQAPNSATALPRSSGNLAAHYAPQTPMRMVSSAEWPEVLADCARRGRRVALLRHQAGPDAGQPWPQVTLPAHPIGYAHGLYDALRQLDHWQLEQILVEALPVTTPAEASAWAAIADRLQRAECGSGSGSGSGTGTGTGH